MYNSKVIMKYSVSSYSFYKMIERGEITREETPVKAKEIGFDGIEFVDFIDFPLDKKEEWFDHAKKLKDLTDSLGLEVTSLAVGADFLNGGDEQVENVKAYIDIAEILGAKRLRHDATRGYAPESGKYCSFDSVVEHLADKFREITEYAETKGIRTMTENHGFYSQDSDRVEKLYTAINHPNFGLLCDMGNFMCADEDPALAFTRLAPYAIYAHAKDFISKKFGDCDPGEGFFRTRSGNYLRGTIIGHGDVPVKQCMYQLKKCGYDDYIAIEFEGMEYVINALTIGLNNLKRYWAELS